MKHTRYLFSIRTDNQNFQQLLSKELQYTGAVTFTKQTLTNSKVFEVLLNNKSVIAISCKMPSEFTSSVIPIIATNFKIDADFVDYINVTDNISQQFDKIVSKYNADIGFKVDSLKNEKKCNFCLNNNSNVLYEGKSFYVTYANDEIINSHLLIVPYKHINSISQMNLNETHELMHIITRLKKHLLLTYPSNKNFFIWEDSSKNIMLDIHTNMHIVSMPFEFDIDSLRRFSSFYLQKKVFYEGNFPTSYLIASDLVYEWNWYMVDTTGMYIPENYIRNIIYI